MLFLSVFLLSWTPPLITRTILVIVFIVFIRISFKIKIDTVISGYLLSYGIGYCLFSISAAIISLVVTPLLSAVYYNDVIYDFNKPIFLLSNTLIAALQFLLAYLLFRIKRFRKGFPFLFEKYTVILALIVAGIVLTMISLFTVPRESYGDDYSLPMLFVGIITVGIGIIIWIRRGIKMFYRQKMKERSIELLEQELFEKERETEPTPDWKSGGSEGRLEAA